MADAYYELSWAILSTVGLFNVLVGFMVMGIAGFSMVSLVPLIVSVATAVANGMCYYAFYSDYPVTNTAAASAFADISWLVQEAGLSFYSYAILVRVLMSRQRLVFLVLFWTLMAAIGGLRLSILAMRLRYILDGSNESDLQRLIDHLHVGYFACIAAVECISAVFLLQTFNSARRISMRAAIQGGLFSYLMRSTEIRLALLALVGVTRAITYSFQNTAQSAEGVAGQLDRFAYTLECLFPVVMYIDILASRLVFASNGRSHETSSNSRSRRATANRRLSNGFGGSGTGHVQMYTVTQSGRRIDTTNDHKSSDATSSQEHIIDPFGATSQIEAGVGVAHGSDNGRATTGISKTVGFEISESRVD
ncbi:hypothetical protein CONLIGDRAFT_647699 [Coniochaeta ligniaria NRRL 30616]|uniref:RTA1-domain-containing protein n=1 Tax=Coniochaeta ligniaria NRRL 30616 TaxID=1408157 RepID=A0A1J7J9V1_9PEZI|nr:hypothetical protein CONLIGDRAFT_647699 [Coniochaeta ligniaria NRRL 30616]